VDQDSDNLRGYEGGFVYMLRSAMLGWPTIMFNSSSWSPLERANAKAEFTTFKTRLRPLIAGGNLYHVLPRPTGNTWDGVQYYHTADGYGVVYAFRPNATEGSVAVVLKGLELDAQYAVSAVSGGLANQTASGRTLMSSGLRISLPKIYSSDLVFVTKSS
jgi:hypothetical protein